MYATPYFTFSPWILFLYGLAVAGSVLVIGAVVLLLLCGFYGAVSPILPHEEEAAPAKGPDAEDEEADPSGKEAEALPRQEGRRSR